MGDQNVRDVNEHAWQAEQRASLILENVRDYAILMLDPDGSIASWPPGAERIHGYHQEEIIGRHFSVFYPPEDVASRKYDEELRNARESGRVEDEGWRVRKDGSLFWASVVLTTVHDRAGNLIGFAKVTRDLTEHRKHEEHLRQSEERFRLLVESVKDYAIFMLSPEGRVLTWNAGAERIKQYRADEIIGQHFARFYPEQDVRSGKCERLLGIATREGRSEDEGWRVRKDGSRFWANVVLTALRDPGGHLVGFAKVTRDLTERREAEEERIRLAQAQEAIRLREEFLSIASHELKTPLTSLHLQLQNLRERLDRSDPTIASKLDRITRSSGRLAQLIETLLDVSRIATGNFSLSPEVFDLMSAVAEVTERLRVQAELSECPLSLVTGAPMIGRWDRLRIEQVVANLLTNAFKYASGSPVEIALRAEGDEALMTVSDGGPGIPGADLDRIFGRFERATSTRHQSGLGLGLYVTREIVQAHGGSISVINQPSGGACFTVRLPLAPRSVSRVSRDSGERSPTPATGEGGSPPSAGDGLADQRGGGRSTGSTRTRPSIY